MRYYADIRPWLAYKKRLIADDYDDVNLVTGREGKGKSKWARKVCYQLDPTFRVQGRIFFDFDAYKAKVGTLQRGQCIILDEARLHKRESMSGDRMEILDHFKENRGLGIHHFIVFNRVSSIDKDLINDRISDWSYIRHRGKVEIRQPKTELVFDKFGQFHESTTYPLVARFPFTDKEPAGQALAYKALKDARMRDRNATLRTEPGASAPALRPSKPMVNPSMLDQVMLELTKGEPARG